MKFLKGLFNLLLATFAITVVLLPVSMFVHEGTHYIMYTLEGIEVTSFHVLDGESFKKGYWGYITPLKISIYGYLFQEGIAYFFQCLFLVSTGLFLLLKPIKQFTVLQLDLMGVKRKTHNAINIR